MSALSALVIIIVVIACVAGHLLFYRLFTYDVHYFSVILSYRMIHGSGHTNEAATFLLLLILHKQTDEVLQQESIERINRH